MTKPDEQVIEEFNQYVNLSAKELEEWLESNTSKESGWHAEGEEGGETVGHDSGRKIVEILKSNPDKDPKKYTSDQIAHMRKVTSYHARHRAQESNLIEGKTDEEVKETKSWRSLMNWGGDLLRAEGRGGAEEDKGKRQEKGKGKAKETEEDEEDENKDDDEEEETDNAEIVTGKRKRIPKKVEQPEEEDDYESEEDEDFDPEGDDEDNDESDESDSAEEEDPHVNKKKKT